MGVVLHWLKSDKDRDQYFYYSVALFFCFLFTHKHKGRRDGERHDGEWQRESACTAIINRRLVCALLTQTQTNLPTSPFALLFSRRVSPPLCCAAPASRRGETPSTLPSVSWFNPPPPHARTHTTQKNLRKTSEPFRLSIRPAAMSTSGSMDDDLSAIVTRLSKVKWV